MKMPPEEAVIPPEGGWEERSFYEAEVSVSHANPTWHAIVYTGFLGADGRPGSYSCVWSPLVDRPIDISELYYIRALKKLDVGVGHL